MADPDDHLDVLLVDRLKLEDLRRVGVEAFDQDHGNHASHEVLDLDIVWRLWLRERRLYFSPLYHRGKVQSTEVEQVVLPLIEV